MSLWSRVKSAVSESFTGKVSKGLSKTAEQVSEGLKAAVGLKTKLDEETREALETVLLKADTGLAAATWLLDNLAKQKLPSPITPDTIKTALAELIETRLKPLSKPLETSESKPFVVLMAGVNGSGKTTTLGKLAARWAAEGKHVIVAAADTFRAGAVEQLAVWTERADDAAKKKGKVTIIGPTPTNTDPATVAYHAAEEALKTKADMLLIDTAGRLATRKDLMDELAKIRRVVQKIIPEAPHAGLLVLDGTQGQATLAQVREFAPVAGLTGVIVTKLDSSAKAGFLLALASQDNDGKGPLPIHYIGVGEQAEDLVDFNPQTFARAVVGLPA